MEDEIRDIQNTLWRMYKEFLQDHDVKKYTRKARDLVDRYGDNREMYIFSQNMVVSWTPVINSLAGRFRNKTI